MHVVVWDYAYKIFQRTFKTVFVADGQDKKKIPLKQFTRFFFSLLYHQHNIKLSKNCPTIIPAILPLYRHYTVFTSICFYIFHPVVSPPPPCPTQTTRLKIEGAAGGGLRSPSPPIAIRPCSHNSCNWVSPAWEPIRTLYIFAVLGGAHDPTV